MDTAEGSTGTYRLRPEHLCTTLVQGKASSDRAVEPEDSAKYNETT
jgi:hypothetical protein